MVQFKNSKPVTEGDESVERKRDVLLSDSKKWVEPIKGMHPFTMTSAELAHLTSLNDRISLQDVQEVMCRCWIILMYILKNILNYILRNNNSWIKEEDGTLYYWGLRKVAVGKSTTARLMQTMLQQRYPSKRVALMTTDGFFASNKKS